jgi:hypothetical protein
VDPLLSRQISYLRDISSGLRKGLLESLIRFGKVQKPKAGEKAAVIAPWIAEIAKAADGGMISPESRKLLDSCTIYIAAEYPEWQVQVLKLVSAAWDELGRKADALPDRKTIIPRLKSLPAATSGDAAANKKMAEACTKFANTVLEDMAIRGAAALELSSPFNEQELIEKNRDFVLRDLGIENVQIKRGEEGPALAAPAAAGAAIPSPEQQAVQVEALAASKALPGKPSPYFFKKQ